MLTGTTVASSVKHSTVSSTRDINKYPKISTSYYAQEAKESQEVEDIKLELNDEKRLLDSLMRGYDRDVRPVRNASHPIIIELGITLTQIFDMVSS